MSQQIRIPTPLAQPSISKEALTLKTLSLTKKPNLENRQFHIIAYLAFCVAAPFYPGLANAAGWEIDPVRIELSTQQQTAALSVKNTTNQSTSIQIQAVTWSQRDGKDVYAPTKELLVSPPIVTIAPKSEQIVRVALRRDADAAKELTYRLNMQEIPPKQSANFTGVKVALRVTLPVFVQSQKGGAKPKMDWEFLRMPNEQFKVTLLNTGNAHVQISDFALYAPGNGKAIAGESGSSYVLEGQTHEWMVKSNSLDNVSNDHLRFTAFTDANNIDTEIVLRKP
jgi:fimbrial chaperone protein